MRENKGFKRLERDKIKRALRMIDDVPLTLVTAPMGYGKTTAVRDYIFEGDRNRVWITLGLDAIPEEWLWNKIIEGFKPIDVELYEAMAQMRLPDGKTEEDMVVSLMAKSLRGAGLYIVVDDYHLCNGVSLNRLFTKLAYEDIEDLHIILIGRGEIDIPYEELLLNNYCIVIDKDDLSFSREETSEIFRLNGVILDDGSLDGIYEYTSGWAAAVSLVWHDYMKNGVLSITGSVRGLLRDSVYRVLDPEDRRLLCQMSLFREFSLEEAEWMTGMKVTEHRMELLISRTGFIYYNIKTQRFSMHSFLCSVAQEELGLWRIDVKHSFRRYAGYHEKKGDLVTALKYYSQAGEDGDNESVFRILERDERFELMENMPEFVHSFFTEMAKRGVLMQHPLATLSYLYFGIMSPDVRRSWKARKLFKAVKEHYKEIYDPEMMGEVLAVEALMLFNDLPKTNEVMRQALGLRNGKPSYIFWRRIYTYGVPETLLLYHSAPGKLLEAVEGEKEYLEHYMRFYYNTAGGLPSLVDGEYLLQTGRPAEAAKAAFSALAKAEFNGQICNVISSSFVIIRASILQGDGAGFRKAVGRCADMMNGVSRPMLVMDYEQMMGYVYALVGWLDRIPLWLREGSFENCNQFVRDSRFCCIVHGAYLCRKGKWAQLLANAERMLPPFAGTNHVFSLIYSHIYMSVANWNLCMQDKADAEMRKALELCRLDNIRLPFAELSVYTVPILKHLRDVDPYVSELLPLCELWLAGVHEFVEYEYTTVEFTPRERELLRLLSDGCRNKEMSKKLNIALVTVEKSLTNIYRKMGVHNRTSAIRWINSVYKL